MKLKFYAIPTRQLADKKKHPKKYEDFSWWYECYYSFCAKNKKEALEQFNIEFKNLLKKPVEENGALRIDKQQVILVSTNKENLNWQIRQIRDNQREAILRGTEILNQVSSYC